MPLREDPREIQDEVMAEITFALNMKQRQPRTSPTVGDVVRATPVAVSPDSGVHELTHVEESFHDEGPSGTTLVETKRGPSGPRRTSSNGDLSGTNDSFVDRMNFSCSSSLGESSTGTLDSQKYFIGGVGADDYSVQSHISNFGTEDMDRDELLEVVRTLYKELRETDRALAIEIKRRQSREKSLIKLAKELKKRKDKAIRLASELDETREELRSAVAENELLEQRLILHKKASSEVRESLQRHVDLETRAIVDRYNLIVAGYEKRIVEISDVHARQCEHLCREVVDANQEVMRLQKTLVEVSRPQHSDRILNSSGTRDIVTTHAGRSFSSLMIKFLIPFIILFACEIWVHLQPAEGSINGENPDGVSNYALCRLLHTYQTLRNIELSYEGDHVAAYLWKKFTAIVLR